jgi:plastocyanin
LPSASTVAHAARQQATDVVAPLVNTFKKARRANSVRYHGETFKAPLAGLPTEIHGSINEFVPRTLHAKANEPITWTFLGTQHTLSFDVAAYLPILEFGAKRIRLNPRVSDPAGGAPTLPEQQGDEPLRIDGGTYDGTGFWSSGLIGSERYATYTLRISKPGTYPYACLIHPKMIAKVVVT